MKEAWVVGAHSSGTRFVQRLAAGSGLDIGHYTFPHRQRDEQWWPDEPVIWVQRSWPIVVKSMVANGHAADADDARRQAHDAWHHISANFNPKRGTRLFYEDAVNNITGTIDQIAHFLNVMPWVNQVEVIDANAKYL